LVDEIEGGDALAETSVVAITTPPNEHARRSRETWLTPRRRIGATRTIYRHPMHKLRTLTVTRVASEVRCD
jgi:hypothetical protein